MGIKLREYQKECVQTIKETFKTKNSQMIQMPTGSGKTYIFLDYLKSNSKKSLIVCPTLELKEQIYESGKKFGMSIEMGLDRKGFADHYVLTASSLNYKSTYESLVKMNFDHVILDECHRSRTNTYEKFLGRLENDYKLLGCTATPERLDGKSLLDIYDCVSYKKNIIDLVKSGELCNIKAYRIKTHCKITTRCADFSPVELKTLDLEKRNEIIISTFFENCVSKKTIIFCLSVDHSIKISKILQEKGINAKAVWGQMPYKERKQTIEDFKSGDIDVLCNCQLLTEGFDAPCIEAIIIARPTKSKSLYCQMVGRGVRNFPGKNYCYLYELGDNVHNICTFNTLCDKPNQFQVDYEPGISLIENYEKVYKLDIHEVKTQKEKFNIFIDQNNILDCLFWEIPCTNYQKSIIEKLGLSIKHDLNFIEASYIIWKDRMRVYYGISR